MARPLFRFVLTGVLVASLLWSGWSWAQLAQSPGAAWLVERAEDELDAAYARAIARHASPQALGQAITRHLTDTPRNWVALDGLADLARAQDVVLPADVSAALAQARAQDFSIAARAASCAACAYDLRACGLGPDLVCGVGVNLTVAGDVLSLSREGAAYLRGEVVDQVDVALSFVGLGATALVLASGGTSYSVKAGAGLLKVAHRTGRLAPDVLAIFTRAFREGVDWAALARGGRVGDAARMDALRPAMALADDLGGMAARLGAGGALHLVQAAETATEARRIARTAQVLGPQTVGAFEVLGKSRFLRAGLRLAAPVWDMLAGLGAALSALAGLIGARLLRALRRAFVR